VDIETLIIGVVVGVIVGGLVEYWLGRYRKRLAAFVLVAARGRQNRQRSLWGKEMAGGGGGLNRRPSEVSAV
jgi:hypothetical protein